MAVLGLRFCARAFSSCGKRGPVFIAVRGPLTIAASVVVEHRLQTRRLSNCGSRAQLLCGMWDLPRPGLEPVSPASAGRFSTTAPPGKPPFALFWSGFFYLCCWVIEALYIFWILIPCFDVLLNSVSSNINMGRGKQSNFPYLWNSIPDCPESQLLL